MPPPRRRTVEFVKLRTSAALTGTALVAALAARRARRRIDGATQSAVAHRCQRSRNL